MQSLHYDEKMVLPYPDPGASGETRFYQPVHDYFGELLAHFRDTPSAQEAPPSANVPAEELAEQVFSVLTGRKFCYLSKKKAAAYKADTLEHLTKNVRAGEPLRFYLDIGGGYHASLFPEQAAPITTPGLGELFILYQIKLFSDRVSQFYPPGVRFQLVIDNLSALFINDIPVAETRRFATQLHEMIRSTNMEGRVELLLESDHCPWGEYEAAVENFEVLPLDISEEEIRNVERFVGRRCGRQEAARRKALYKAVISVSERCLGRVIDGVHMTQRATPNNLCFRAFPGADSRIQCGEIAMHRKESGKLVPILLTSSNIKNYSRKVIHLDMPVPKTVSRITLAFPC